jgi:hypothetical protein
MSTKVFISWSGALSQKIAQALAEWLPAALQNVKPYFSPEDTEKGSLWDTVIASELKDSKVGIICLTRYNTEKPWILFEAGALSKSMEEANVCTLLFSLEPADVKPPLARFQATQFTKADFKRLIATINDTAGDARLEARVLDTVFDKWWPELEANVNRILTSHTEDGTVKRRTERDLLEEVLQICRAIDSRSQTGPSTALVSGDEYSGLASLIDDETKSRLLMHIAREQARPGSLHDAAKSRRLLQELVGLYVRSNTPAEDGTSEVSAD